MSDVRATVCAHIEEGRPDLAIRAALDGLERGSHYERHAARRMLAWCTARIPGSSWPPDSRRKALEAGFPVAADTPSVGVCWFPAVAYGRGRLVRVRVRTVQGGPRDAVHCDVDPPQRHVVEQAVAVARAETDAEDSVEVAFDHPDWRGPSSGLAIALASWSALHDTALPSSTVATGALEPDGRVVDVGGRPEKLRLLAECTPGSKILTPDSWPGSDPREVPVSTFRAALRVVAPEDELDVDRALQRVRATAGRGDWAETTRAALDLVESGELEGNEPVEMLGIALRGATATCSAAHQARCFEAARRIDRLARRPGALQLIGSAVVSRIDQLDEHRARQWLALIDPDHVGEHEMPHALGPMAMLHTLQGKLEHAYEIRQRSLYVATPSERPRCRGDLADAAWRLGRYDEALDHATRAIHEARATRRHKTYQEHSIAYLALHQARVLLALGRGSEALEALDHGIPLQGIDPAYRYALLRAEILGNPAIVDEACARLTIPVHSVPILAALRWRTRSRLGVDPTVFDAPCFQGASAHAVWMRIPY